MTATLTYIGKITTPYTSVEECPNNVEAQGPICRITLFEKFNHGLTGLAAGDTILVLYWLSDALRDQMLQVGRQGKNKAPLLFVLHTDLTPSERQSFLLKPLILIRG